MADSLWNESGQSDFYRDVANAENGLAMLNNTISSYKANKSNERIARESNEWSYRTQMELALLQPELEYDLWLKQLNTNVYDAKMKQLAAAGINPYVAAGKVANVQESALHAGGQQAPHPVAFPYQPYYQPVDSVSGLAAAFSALAQSDKTKEETKRIGALLAGEVEGQYLENASKRFEHEMDLAFEGLERNSKLRLTKQEVIESMERASKAAAEGDKASMESFLAQVRARRENLAGMMDEKRLEKIDEIIDAEIDEVRSRSEKNRAEGQEARAHAGLFNSQRISEDAARAFEENHVRPYTAQMIMNDATMSQNEMVDYYTNRQDRLEAELEGCVQAKIITEQERARLKQEVAKGNYAEVRELFETVGSAARSFRDYRYGSSSGYTNRSRSRRY